MALVSSRGGYKKLKNLPVPRSSVYESRRQVTRAVLDQLYSQQRLWDRVSELDKRRNKIADLKGFSMASRTVIPLDEGITVFNAMTGVCVAHIYEAQAHSYHDLYQEVRCKLNVSMSMSVALVFRSSPNPACIFYPGEMIPAHRAGCMRHLRGSMLDVVVHR